MKFQRNPDKMHRVEPGAKSDWENIPHEDRTVLQKIAAKTHGLATLANGVSVAGFAVVMNGLYDYANGNKTLGLAKIIGGRVGDVIDGTVADMTKTKSEVGAATDGTLDTVAIAASLPVLVNTKTIPLAIAGIVAVPKIINAASTVAAKVRGKEINSTGEGKIGSFAIWTGIGSFMVHAAFENKIPGLANNILVVAGWGGTLGGTAIGLPATQEYYQVGFRNGRQGEIVANQTINDTDIIPLDFSPDYIRPENNPNW